MAASSPTVVIKVKYGDMLRRFNAPIVDGNCILNMDGLRGKIRSLFSFAPVTDLLLTYVDEDGDVVALVDDDDLRDVVKQRLNPVRITVKVKDDNNDNQNNSSASSTPLKSTHAPNLNADISEILRKSAGISEILRKVPKPLRETLMKLSDDLASKVLSSSPGISELVDQLTNVSLSYLGQLSESELVDQLSNVSLSYLGQLSESGVNLTMPSGVTESSLATDNIASEPLKVDPAATLEKPEPVATVERKGVKSQNVTGQRKEGPSFDFNAVAAALESQNDNVFMPESSVASHSVRRKEKVKKTAEFSNGIPHVRINLPYIVDNVGKDAEFSVGSSSARDSDLMNVDHVSDMMKSVVYDASENAPVIVDNVGKVAEFSVGSSSARDSDLRNVDHVSDKMKSVVYDAFENAPVTWSPYKGGLNLGSLCGPSAMHEDPFSGTSLENTSAAPPHTASDAIPFRRSQNDSSGSIFHRGVRCDGCGIHPIVGPRFKSKVRMDYDLCRLCFEKMGTANDYTRMDRPAVYRHPLQHFRAREHGAMFPPHVYRAKCKVGGSKLDSRFIQDVNIFDGTVMAPLTPFTKIWRMRNNGTVGWPRKTQLVWIGGDKLTDGHSVEVQIPAAGLLMDQELNVAIDFISPKLPGRYISYWRMSSPTGQKFGQRIWVLIQVDATTIGTQMDSVRNLNLNLPPVSSTSLTGPEIIVNQEPAAEASFPYLKVAYSTKVVESELLPDTENELKFPINDSLLVGNGAGSSSSPAPSSSLVTYPILDLSDMVPSIPTISPAILFPMPPPPPPSLPSASSDVRILMPPPPPPPSAASPSVTVARAPEPAAELPSKSVVEDRLLRELEEMGFKQVDLNKEVLRMNEYDLEQALDDLCGVAEWDPILEELQEMGFNDAEMNKKLLRKNGGSIKRVVMDLIAGEEEEA